MRMAPQPSLEHWGPIPFVRRRYGVRDLEPESDTIRFLEKNKVGKDVFLYRDK
jgi:hypothetical protein